MLTQKTNIYTIPGWGFQASIFNALNDEKFNVVGLDYMDMPTNSIREIAQHLSNTLPDQVILIGWSLGGLIAIQLASLFANKVKKLILLAAQPRLLSTFNLNGIEQDNARHFVKAIMQNFNKQMDYFISLSCFPNLSSTLKQTLRQHVFFERKQQLTDLLNLLLRADLRAEYCQLKMSILHIISDQDAIIPQDALQLKALNPNIRSITFQNSGHAGFLTSRAAYMDILEGFINDY